MKKEKSLVLVLSVCLLISIITNFVLAACLFNKGVHSERKNISIASTNAEAESEESTPVVDSELNRTAREARSISLYTNYNEDDYKYEKGYSINRWDYSAYFQVMSEGYMSGDSIAKSGEYSLEILDEVIDILCKYELKEYRPQTNENGQVIKGTIPYLVIINKDGKSTMVEVSNIEELAEKMISLGDNLK